MEIINDVLVVGDKNVVRDLFYPEVLGRNGKRRLRTVIAPGGSKSGYTMGERLIAFEEAGIDACRFDAGLATSSGAYNMVAYCAKQTKLIPEIYRNLSWFNIEVLKSVFKRGDYLGLMYLEDCLRRILDVETFKKCKMDLSIVVADLLGNPIVHNAKRSDDIFDLMFASSALFPVVPSRQIKGVESVDGGFTVRSSTVAWTRQMLKEMPKHHPVDILYVANRPHPQHEDHFEEWIFRWISTFFMRGYPELLRGALSITPKLSKTASVFEHQPPNQRRCAIFPLVDENVYPNEWNATRLQLRGELTRSRMENFLKTLKPAREI